MINSRTDLIALCDTVELASLAALDQLESRPYGGYGPRVWLSYQRKKAIERELRHMLAEARLIRSTTPGWQP